MKALKVTVSGSYQTSNNEIIDFEDVTGIIPMTVDEEHAKMHVRSRYASEWVKNATDKQGNKLYPKRVDSMYQIFVDEIESVDHKFSYVGKDIKKMSYEELQDLATAKDLRTVPKPKSISGVDLREMRMQAYLGYMDRVLHKPIDVRNPLPEHANKNSNGNYIFDYAKLPELIVDGEARAEESGKITNEDIIEQEMKPMMANESPQDNLTLKELKDIASKKNISYHPTIGFDALYQKIFGTPS